MKKINQDTKMDNNISFAEKETDNRIKTTNVNILLNRVRLDKRKSLRKKIIISSALISIITAITAYFIIQNKISERPYLKSILK